MSVGISDRMNDRMNDRISDRISDVMEGSLCDMDSVIYERVTTLGERALQRKRLYPIKKTQEDSSLENKLFDEMKNIVYTQITSD